MGNNQTMGSECGSLFCHAIPGCNVTDKQYFIRPKKVLSANILKIRLIGVQYVVYFIFAAVQQSNVCYGIY